MCFQTRPFKFARHPPQHHLADSAAFSLLGKWKCLVSTSDTSINIHQLAGLGLSLPTLCQMKFTWSDLRKIGGTCQTIRLLTPKLSEIKTYFSPTKEEWEAAGFTEEAMNKYKYEVDVDIIKKKPVKRRGQIKLNTANMLF